MAHTPELRRVIRAGLVFAVAVGSLCVSASENRQAPRREATETALQAALPPHHRLGQVAITLCGDSMFPDCGPLQPLFKVPVPQLTIHPNHHAGKNAQPAHHATDPTVPPAPPTTTEVPPTTTSTTTPVTAPPTSPPPSTAPTTTAPDTAPASGTDPVTPEERAEWTKVADCEEGGWVGYSGPAYPDSLGINAYNWYANGGGSDVSEDAQIMVAMRIQSDPPDQNGCDPGGW